MSAKISGLTVRQSKFVRAYIETGNATSAAKQAGYGKRTAAQTASRLLRNVKVSAEINKRRKKAAIDAGLSLSDLIIQTKRVTDKSEQNGKYDATFRGLRLQAELGGFLTKRTEHTGADGGPIALATMTDAEIEQKLRELEAEEDDEDESSRGTIDLVEGAL